MGIVIKARDLPALERSGIQRPIIYCNPDAAIIDSAVSLNVNLAKRLAAIKPNRRTMRMEQCFRQVVESLPDDVVVKDFDVLCFVIKADKLVTLVSWELVIVLKGVTL